MKKLFFVWILLFLCGTVAAREKFSFVFLADLHLFGTEKIDSAFVPLVDYVNDLDPDFVLTGGDHVYTCKNASIEASGELYDRWEEQYGKFDAPVFQMIGNHDKVGVLAESGADPSDPLWGDRMYERRIGPRYYSFMFGGWKFIVLDRFRVDVPTRNYYPETDPEQLAWLEAELARTAPEVPLVLASHVPLISPVAMFVAGEPALSEDAARILELCRGHNLRLVLQAHFHVFMDLFSQGVRYVSGPPALPLPGLRQEDQGIVRITVDDGQIGVEWQQEYFREQPACRKRPD